MLFYAIIYVGDVMTIAVDKESVKYIDKKNKKNYIYIFNDESLDELLDLDMRCINYEYCEYVDINTTKYILECAKKCDITDKDYDKLPPKKDYKFAIIIPNCNNDHGEYKGKTFLRNCIESVLNQTYKNFQLIIVDDMSTDNSVASILEYKQKDKRVHLINNRRKRYNGGSRNVGIDYAFDNVNFDYFCFLDSDDWWKSNDVLETINSKLYEHDMMLIGMELLDKNGVFMTKFHEYNNYKDFFLSDNKVWCTAWARVIKKEKIVYFCEDTLMEDRVWSYKQADNVDINKVINLKKVCYVWNRMNTSNSVSMVRNNYWNASAYCHVGHQLQMLDNLKHKEMIPIIKNRAKQCIEKIRSGIYQQY